VTSAFSLALPCPLLVGADSALDCCETGAGGCGGLTDAAAAAPVFARTGDGNLLLAPAFLPLAVLLACRCRASLLRSSVFLASSSRICVFASAVRFLYRATCVVKACRFWACVRSSVSNFDCSDAYWDFSWLSSSCEQDGRKHSKRSQVPEFGLMPIRTNCLEVDSFSLALLS
jgi:hypothetical protein